MIKMGDVNTDEEKPFLCILKLLKKGSNDDFKKLQKLCEEISDDMQDLNEYNNGRYMDYAIDKRAKEQLVTFVAKERDDVANLTPVETIGDGSCLFRTLSFLYFGHPNRHRELRVRCIIEMAVNKDCYLGDKGLLERSKAEANYIMKKSNAGKFGKSDKSKSDQSASGTGHDSGIANGSYEETSSVDEAEIIDDTQHVDHDSEESGNVSTSGVDPFEAYFTKDVLKTCDSGEFAKFWHVQALGVILKRKIEIICSSSNETEELKEAYIQLKEHFERPLDPAALDVGLESNTPPFKIMWLLDDQHFVPLISASEITYTERDSGLGESLKESEEADATVKKEPNAEDSDGIHVAKDLEPSHTSTPKKAAKGKPSIEQAIEKSEKDEDSDDSDDEIVDITSGDNVDHIMNKLIEVFDVEYDIKTKLLKHPSIDTLKSLTGPKQVADPKILGISKSGTIKFVARLIEVQFQIKWKTSDGRPEWFNFYDFCNVEKHAKAKQKKGLGKTAHLKYDPRRAHIFTELYRKAVDMEAFFTDKLKDVFCPDVYVRVMNYGWVKICFARKICEQVKNFDDHFSWMHPSLRTFVAEADEITLPNSEVVYSSVTKAIYKKYTLYWAVLDDTDFTPGDHLQLHEIGKTQVYVGKANGGIRGRWISDGGSHAEKMKKCAESICKMGKSFDVFWLKGIQLVDARLLLAKIRKEKHAVFLMRKFQNEIPLMRGEDKHKKGKRIGEEDANIVLDEDIGDAWTPKEMEFGMNYN